MEVEIRKGTPDDLEAVIALLTMVHENMEQKKAIIEKLKTFLQSEVDEKVNQQVRELIKEWNSIGHVPFKDKDKIYKNGRECEGFSDLYYTTKDTLSWDCDPTQFSELLLEIFQMLSVDFFLGALDTLAIFRASVTERKRMRTAERK